jgi:hypothetical protein
MVTLPLKKVKSTMTAKQWVTGRLAQSAGLHILGNARLPRNRSDTETASAWHGLPSECAVRVLDLHVDATTDLAVVPLLARVLEGPETFQWSERSPVLPPAPPLLLSDNEIAEAEQQTENAARLSAMDESGIQEQSYSDQDLAPLRQAASRQRRKALMPDALAFYRPFTLLKAAQAVAETDRVRNGGEQWGIYLTSGGIELLAREVFAGIGLTDQQALMCALAFLLGHEFGHLIIDLALAEDDLEHGWAGDAPERVEPLSRTHNDRHSGYACRKAEAFCEAYALRFLATSAALMTDLTPEARIAALDAAQEHVADGLPGYRDGADIRGPHALFESLRALLNHAGVDKADRAALQADLERHTINTPDIPIHIVVTPSSALDLAQWCVATMRRPNERL